MAKNTINETTAIEMTESALPATEIESMETVEPVEPTEVLKPSIEQVVTAVLSSAFQTSTSLTGYQLHTIINVSLEILQVEKDGKLVQVPPQMIYNATRLRKGERMEWLKALQFCINQVARRSGEQVSSGARIDRNALLASAMKTLS